MVRHQTSVGGFAAGGFFGADQAGGHIWNAVDGVVVEGVVIGVFGVPQDVVVLGGPARFGAAAVIVGPDDFVDEGIAAKYFVQHYLAIVDFPVVDVEEQAAVVIQQTVGFGHAGTEEADVVVEIVGVPAVADDMGTVAAALETGAVAVGVGRDLDASAGLGFAGVEGRVNVDELERAIGQGGQDIKIVAKYNIAHCAPPVRGRIIRFASEGVKRRRPSPQPLSQGETFA